MTGEDPKYYRRKDAEKRQSVAWNPPAERQQQVYTHVVTCDHCGRHFTVESLMPIPPQYCLKEDQAGCYAERKRAYFREYRAKKKGEMPEENS